MIDVERNHKTADIIPMSTDIEKCLTNKRRRDRPMVDIISTLLCDIVADAPIIRYYADQTAIPVLNPMAREVLTVSESQQDAESYGSNA